MKSKNLINCCLTTILLLQTAFAISQNSKSNEWTQFRGNNRNGISKENGLLKKQPGNGPKLAWKKEIGFGFSEITIANGKFFTMYGKKENNKGYEYVAAFDLKTGKEIWNTKVDSLFVDPDG